jgi:hypothetical protein
MTHNTQGKGRVYLLSDEFRPFSNGEEFRQWLAQNCERGHKGCRRYNPEASSSRHGCPIEVALAKASISDGTIPARTALRGGFLEAGANGQLVQPDEPSGECPEYKGYDESDDRPRRGPRPPAGQEDLLDPRNAPTHAPSTQGVSGR